MEHPPHAERVLAAFAEHAPPILREQLTMDACINTTWIVCRVLQQWAVPARPLACSLMVFNPAMTRKAKQTGRLPQSAAEREAWFAECGAHGIGIVRGQPLRAESWLGGHLVAVAGDIVIDASIKQVERPRHGIVVPPVLFLGATAEELAGKVRLAEQRPDGTLLLYEFFPLDTSYLPTPGWRNPRNEHIAQEILAAMTTANPLEAR